MESEVSAAGILVAGLGVFATGAGYVLRQYNEDRRIARTVLFNLLGIWEVCVVRSRPLDKMLDAALGEYNSAFNEVFGGEAKGTAERYESEIGSLVRPLLIKAVLSNLPVLTDELRQSYLSSLERLSERHPVLAYRLNGREKIDGVFHAVEEYEKNINQALQPAMQSGDVKAVVETAQKIARTSIARQMVDDLGQDLIRVGWVAGIGNWVRCKGFVRKSKNQYEPDRKSLLDLRQECISVLLELRATHAHMVAQAQSQ